MEDLTPIKVILDGIIKTLHDPRTDPHEEQVLKERDKLRRGEITLVTRDKKNGL